MLSFIDQGTFFQIILCAFCKLTYISSEAPLYNRRFINPFSLLRKSGYKYTFQLSVPRLHGSSGPQELPSVSVNRDRVWLGHALPWLNILRNIEVLECVCVHLRSARVIELCFLPLIFPRFFLPSSGSMQEMTKPRENVYEFI